MDILDAVNKHVKIGKTSITVKDNNTRKTCGVVQGIRKFKDLRVCDQMEHFKNLRRANIWGCGVDGVMDAIIVTGDCLCYLHNLKPIETYDKYFKDQEMFSSEGEMYEKRLLIAENMKQFATVIPCYID